MTDDGFTDQPPLRCGGILGAMLLLLLLVLPGCKSYPQAEKACRTGIAVNKGHAQDKALPAEARAVAEDNHDLLWKVLFNIGGCEEKDIPADVKARQAKRGAK